VKTKRCSKCKKEKPINAFGQNKTAKDGLFHWCKNCINKYNREWSKNNPIIYWCSSTIKGHKRRGYEVFFKACDLFPIAIKTKYCPICNKELEYNRQRSSKNASLDRINNENVLTLDNTQIICHRCNATKYDRTMKELAEWCKNFLNYYNYKN